MENWDSLKGGLGKGVEGGEIMGLIGWGGRTAWC